MNKLRLLVAVIGMSALLVGCSSTKRFAKYHHPNSIPADIKKNGYVLLVIKQDIGTIDRKVNRYVDKYMRKFYGAPYELIDYNELKSEKYADTDKYRYSIMGNYAHSNQADYINDRGQRRSLTVFDMYIRDRKTDIQFTPTGVQQKNFGLLMKDFAKFMKDK